MSLFFIRIVHFLDLIGWQCFPGGQILHQSLKTLKQKLLAYVRGNPHWFMNQSYIARWLFVPNITWISLLILSNYCAMQCNSISTINALYLRTSRSSISFTCQIILHLWLQGLCVNLCCTADKLHCEVLICLRFLVDQ